MSVNYFTQKNKSFVDAVVKRWENEEKLKNIYDYNWRKFETQLNEFLETAQDGDVMTYEVRRPECYSVKTWEEGHLQDSCTRKEAWSLLSKSFIKDLPFPASYKNDESWVTLHEFEFYHTVLVVYGSRHRDEIEVTSDKEIFTVRLKPGSREKIDRKLELERLYGENARGLKKCIETFLLTAKTGDTTTYEFIKYPEEELKTKVPNPYKNENKELLTVLDLVFGYVDAVRWNAKMDGLVKISYDKVDNCLVIKRTRLKNKKKIRIHKPSEDDFFRN